MQPVMIEIKNVSRKFNMAREKVDSFKEWMIRKFKGNLQIDEFSALKDISLTVCKGDVYGLVGLNGSGKSTLLKIIAGVMKPSSGTCRVYGTIAPLIELGAGFDPDLTGRENVFLNAAVLGISHKVISDNYQDVVDFSELHEFMDVPVKNYSSGMVARLAFSIATAIKPEILICDEVLSVGDFLFQEKCEARMKELMGGGTTVLIVSHAISQIGRLCNKVVWIHKGRVVMDGSCEEVCEAYAQKAEEKRGEE